MINKMGSADEAEIGATYLNGQEFVPICTTISKMGHPQPPTPMQVNNSTIEGFANRTIKQKRSKSIDMRFYWIQDRVRQRQFLIYWQPGSTNLGYCRTKHHSRARHRLMSPTYIHPKNQLDNNIISLLLWGYFKPSPQSRVIHTTRQPGLISRKSPITQLVTNPSTNAV